MFGVKLIYLIHITNYITTSALTHQEDMSDTGPSFTKEECEAHSDIHRWIADGSHPSGLILEEAAMKAQ